MINVDEELDKHLNNVWNLLQVIERSIRPGTDIPQQTIDILCVERLEELVHNLHRRISYLRRWTKT